MFKLKRTFLCKYLPWLVIILAFCFLIVTHDSKHPSEHFRPKMPTPKCRYYNIQPLSPLNAATNTTCPPSIDPFDIIESRLIRTGNGLINYTAMQCFVWDKKKRIRFVPPSMRIYGALAQIECFDAESGALVHEDTIPTIVSRPFGAIQRRVPINCNVLVVVIHGVSRPTFHGAMVRTLDVLNTYRAYEMHRVNAMNPSRIDNWLAMTRGCVRDVRNCDDYIWDIFARNGYIVSYFEDRNERQVVRDVGKSFDLFWSIPPEIRPLLNYPSAHGTHYCMKNKPLHRLLFKFTMETFQRANVETRSIFQWVALNAMEYAPQHLYALDVDLAQFLIDFKRYGFADTTIVLLTSDRGTPIQPAPLNERAQFERIMPFLYVHIPNPLLARNMEIGMALYQNRYVEISPLFIYFTLRRIADDSAARREQKLNDLFTPHSIDAHFALITGSHEAIHRACPMTLMHYDAFHVTLAHKAIAAINQRVDLARCTAWQLLSVGDVHCAVKACDQVSIVFEALSRSVVVVTFQVFFHQHSGMFMVRDVFRLTATQYAHTHCLSDVDDEWEMYEYCICV